VIDERETEDDNTNLLTALTTEHFGLRRHRGELSALPPWQDDRYRVRSTRPPPSAMPAPPASFSTHVRRLSNAATLAHGGWLHEHGQLRSRRPRSLVTESSRGRNPPGSRPLSHRHAAGVR
jgi:hypothetical protein